MDLNDLDRQWECDGGIMKFNDQVWACHSEGSEESDSLGAEILRFPQNGMPVLLLGVTNHYAAGRD